MKVRLGVGLASLLFLSACGDEPQQEHSLPGTETAPQILAHVNDSSITADEFEVARSRFSAPDFMLDAKFDQTLLQSLINSRAMALLVQEEMDSESVKMLNLKVAAYREELLVKEYLKRHATPEPVTETMVQQYYNEHPDEFAGGKRVQFEYLRSTGSEQDEINRKRILTFIANAREAANWEGLLGAEADLPLQYRKVRARLSVLDEPMKTLVESTAKDETSSVHVGKEIIVVRVLDTEQLQARPLSEVSGEIRKRLAPMQLRKSVKQLSATALQKVKVQYPNNKN
jgi:hypothetical protein